MMKKIFSMIKNLCAGVGAVVLVLLLILLVSAYYTLNSRNIEDKSYLMVDLNQSFAENSGSGVLNDFFGEKNISFLELLKVLELAASDNRIDGLVADINITSLDLAQTQELAEAVKKFRSSGKKTYVYSSGFGPFGYGNREYYLASFFDEIYMQPHTYIGLTGISIEVPFVRGVLEKLGINPEFYSRYEYKTAMASLTDETMSSYYRSELNGMASDIAGTIGEGISQNRKLKTDIKQIINTAPIKAENGIKEGLIDGIMYRQELEEKLKKDGVSGFVDVIDYATLLQPNEGDIPVIAYLSLNGVIAKEADFTEIGEDSTISSKNVLADIQEISEIENLKALVLRINSPGGEYNAADEIYFALQKLKKDKNIPIIISQGGYAASGGYFISLAGDYIFSEPMSITGSIGVLGGKISLEKMWQKLGINWDEVKIGNNSDFLSSNKNFSPQEVKIFNESLDDVYNDFTAKVTENRKSVKNIDEVARGRVWTGKQAKDLGLVDALGGLKETLLYAHQQSGINPNEPFELAEFPKPKSDLEKITELWSKSKISTDKIFGAVGVDIEKINLFKRWQYDMVLIPFEINM